ncbi:hypothetical protein MLD38_026743 [Melastoma candidum]|uniref:Uncharacterized protein n=1 Tax=Melastoma candidum TaxID=119954 RepID=A0ACB9NZJ0_9MYRT|nr:hypothetical protein MLD38_026743 [Melastoma candidum]
MLLVIDALLCLQTGLDLTSTKIKLHPNQSQWACEFDRQNTSPTLGETANRLPLLVNCIEVHHGKKTSSQQNINRKQQPPRCNEMGGCSAYATPHIKQQALLIPNGIIEELWVYQMC